MSADSARSSPVFAVLDSETTEPSSCGGRLVGDQQLRLVRHRHRDHDALQLPAGQLVRVRPEPLAGRGQPDQAEQLDRPLAGRGRGQHPVGPDRLDELVADGEHRVQRAHRLLEHHADVAAADRAQLGRGHRVQVAPGQLRAPGHLRRGREQAEQGHRGDRLAGAGLPDHRDDFARVDLVTDPADGFDVPERDRHVVQPQEPGSGHWTIPNLR
jgi:hypothetical protein